MKFNKDLQRKVVGEKAAKKDKKIIVLFNECNVD